MYNDGLAEELKGMSYMNGDEKVLDKNLEVKRLFQDTIDEQVFVFRQSFQPDEDEQDTKKWWIAKHYTNPVNHSYVFGVYDGKKLVSINDYMPLIYKYNGKSVQVLESCESGTLPEYRGMGLWSMVVKYAIAYLKEEGKYDFLIGFPNYRNSYGGFMKMGWNHVCDVTNQLMISNGREVMYAVLGIKPFFAAILEIQHLRIKLIAPRNYSISSHQICCQSREQEMNGFHIVRDDEFVRWKKRTKHLESFVINSESGEPLANFYFSIGKYAKSKVGILYPADILKAKVELKKIYAFGISQIMKMYPEIAFIRYWSVKRNEDYRIMKNLFFITLKHPNPFITYLLKDDLVRESELQDTKNWKSLSFFDLD